MKSAKFIYILLAGIIIYGIELAICFGAQLNIYLKIFFGFLALFFLPGYFWSEVISKKADFLDKLAWSTLLTIGYFSLFGLAFFIMKSSLELIFWSFLGLGILSWLVALSKNYSQKNKENKLQAEEWIVLGLIIAPCFIAFFMGAFRGPEHDWDLYNYIAQVRKFLVWEKADIHHYYYIDAPPDPIHSYNLWALLWSLIAYKNRIDPIPLYIHSAFLTIPLCFFSFFSFARKVLGRRAGFFAFCFYYFYQLIYAGLQFTARSTFYPADSMWLLCFPALLSLTFAYLDEKKIALLIFVGLSSLAVSIIHTLWGLAFYLFFSIFGLAEFLKERNLKAIISLQKNKGARKFLLILFWLFIISPFSLSFIYILKKGFEQSKNWFVPIFQHFPLDSISFYSLVFIFLPLIIFLYLTKKPAQKIPSVVKDVFLLIAFCLMVSIPYIYLRAEVIKYTQWESFGRNPYRALITPHLFFLNPFKRSIFNPNMSFHPFFWLALIVSLALIRKRKSMSQAMLASLYSFLGIVALIFHPASATLFAKLFSLGYLRRVLRITALLGFLFPGFLLEKSSHQSRKKAKTLALGIALAIITSIAIYPLPTERLYKNMLRKMIFLCKKESRASLLDDSTPFVFLKKHNLIEPNDVVFSDIFTSFRLGAYLGCYVAVQHKPGVGVPDQDERRKEEIEFFSPQTSLERILEILKIRKARWIIINRNPQYRLPAYPLSFGHPETAGKLSRYPEFFEKIYDQKDWVIFKVKKLD